MSKIPRNRNMMYTQQIQYMSCQDSDSLYSSIETKLKPDKFAVITHDKDNDDKGKPAEPHVHVMMSFNNARSVKNVAKLLGDKEQYIELWNDKATNGFAYLTHRTEKARDKYQYDPAEVKANFDYPAELTKITQQVAKAKPRKKADELLDGLYDGTYLKEDVEKRMTGSQYGKSCKQIEDIEAKRLQQEAEEFRKNMIASGKPLRVIWIYGVSGTGKTSFAKEIAGKNERPYYISGSSRDIFQAYKGEHTVILDEFRAGVIRYEDLLRITDPYGTVVMAPARYHDKYLACDLIIFTSPYSPYEFYEDSFKQKSRGYYDYFANAVNTVDKFDQFQRRISLTLYMNEKKIYRTKYIKSKGIYTPVKKDAKVNLYSTSARQNNTNTDATELFDSLFD